MRRVLPIGMQICVSVCKTVLSSLKTISSLRMCVSLPWVVAFDLVSGSCFPQFPPPPVSHNCVFIDSDSVSVSVFGSNLDSLSLSLSTMKCSFSCAACVCIINKNHFKFEITIKNGNDKVSSVGKYGDQEAAVTQNSEDCSTA